MNEEHLSILVNQIGRCSDLKIVAGYVNLI